MLGIAQTIRRRHHGQPVSPLVAEGGELANEALSRMEDAGLVDPDSVAGVDRLRSDFAAAREQVLATR